MSIGKFLEVVLLLEIKLLSLEQVARDVSFIFIRYIQIFLFKYSIVYDKCELEPVVINAAVFEPCIFQLCKAFD